MTHCIRKHINPLLPLLSLLVFCVSASSLMAETATTSTNNNNISSDKESVTKTDDFQQIIDSGVLRILAPPSTPSGFYLPRSDSPMDNQLAMAKSFARSLNLTPKIIPILSFKDVFPSLIRGEGDMIVSNLTVTEERKKSVAFSIPILYSNEVVLVPKTDTKTAITKDLVGKRLILSPSSSFWQRGVDFKKRYPGIHLVKQASYLTDEEVIDMVAKKEYDATIRDSNIAEMYLTYRDDLRAAFNASGKQEIAIALRQRSVKLKEAFDHFLRQKQLETFHINESFGDLSDLKKRGVIRILLRNNASSYFLWKGNLMGFEYEMAKAYARHLGVRLAVYVPKDGEDPLKWLLDGKVDLVAGFLQEQPYWSKKGVAASIPYHQAFAHIVVRDDNTDLNAVSDLDGRTVFLHRSSPHWDTLENLEKKGIFVNLIEAPEELEVEEIIQKVAKGDYDITIADQQNLRIEIAYNTPVKSAFTIGKQIKHNLAVRQKNPLLLQDLNAYLKKNKKGKLYKKLYAKYFTSRKKIQRYLTEHKRLSNGKKVLSDYDDLVQKYSEKYGFDWRFITAQIFQESKFDPNAISSAGAIGLMQIMPSTGKHLGFSHIKEPSNNIHAGTKYMKWLYNKFESDLSPVDHIWFTLAAYNAGLGHVLDARRLAKQLGLNKNKWFGHVEKAMLLLSRNQYAKKSRYGYVRGSEPVKYVKSIKRIYTTYLNIVPDKEDAASDKILEDSITQSFQHYFMLSSARPITINR